MKRQKVFAFALSMFAVLVLLTAAPAAKAGTYQQIATIIPPGGLTSFDIGWVDGAGQTYYLADRTGGGRIDVIDAKNNTLLFSIPGFAGPNGILVINKGEPGGGKLSPYLEREAWVGDKDSTVKVVEIASHSIVDSIATGGSQRADELAYDPKDKIIMVANDSDTPPFVTFISTKTHAVLGHISYPQATDGLEQPVWDQRTKTFFFSVPATTTNPGGEIDDINPLTMQVVNIYPVDDCAPHGLTLGPSQHLLLGCGHARSIIMDALNGSIIANITQVGGSDEVWFNQGEDRYYLAASNFPSGPVLGVIDADTNQWITNVPTAPHSHSVAADSQNDHVFVPIIGTGIVVFAEQ